MHNMRNYGNKFSLLLLTMTYSFTARVALVFLLVFWMGFVVAQTQTAIDIQNKVSAQSDVQKANDKIQVEKVVLVTPRPLSDFQLLDQDNKKFDLHNLQGKWTLMFFGYTHCPDVCPLTTSILDDVYRSLDAYPQIKQDTQVVFVSVDPYRDQPEMLKKYIRYYNDDFIAAVAPMDVLNVLTDQMGVQYRHLIVEQRGTHKRQFVVEHSAAIYLIDPKARLVAKFAPPHDQDVLGRQYVLIRQTGQGALPIATQKTLSK
jgi:protein SCO1/2